jgi:hypothetical protein
MSATDPGKNINGKELQMYFKRDADPDYLLGACNVDLSFTMSAAVTPNTTKCGVSKSFAPVDAKATFNGEARVDIDPADDALSYNDLVTLQQDGTAFMVKIVDPNDKIYIVGQAQFSEVALTANSTEAVKFTANLEYLAPGEIDFTPTT